MIPNRNVAWQSLDSSNVITMTCVHLRHRPAMNLHMSRPRSQRPNLCHLPLLRLLSQRPTREFIIYIYFFAIQICKMFNFYMPCSFILSFAHLYWLMYSIEQRHRPAMNLHMSRPRSQRPNLCHLPLLRLLSQRPTREFTLFLYLYLFAISYENVLINMHFFIFTFLLHI